MNVDTLLEAAKFIELQEEKEKLRLNHTSEISASRPAPPLQNQIQTATTPALIRARQDLPTTTTTMTVTAPTPTPRIINNSFDIINPLVIDEGGEQKRKQPPMVFRSGTREVHNKLEKHRRAHLKECFDTLKKQLPKTQDERKSSNLSILHSALRYIRSLKTKEAELEHEMEKLARDKISYQQKLAILKKEVNSDGIDLATLLPEIAPQTPPSLHHHHLQHHHHHQDSQLSQEPATHEIKNGIVDNNGVVLEQKLLKQSVVQRPVIPAQINGVKESAQVQATALSVVPVSYPMSQGLVLQKVAFVPGKGLTELSPLVSTNPTVATFIAAPQQLHGGKVVPIVNAQYVVKPVVVVSTPSRPS